MVAVRFDPNRQLHLTDRKVVAARLCRLIGLTALDTGETPSDWKLFANDLHGLIDETLDKQRQDLDGSALDQTLRDVTEKMAPRINGGSSPAVHQGFKAFSDAVENYDCERCGTDPNRMCEGSFRDRKLFLDGNEEPGGVCMGFVRELIQSYQQLAEDYFKEFAPNIPLRQAPAELLVRMSGRPRSHDGTLPIDGRYEADETTDRAFIDVEWPEARQYKDIDEGILMIPYLVFHEVFVHGGQGRALEDPITNVPSSCSFTEGAVDAAARDILMWRVLADPTSLPAEVAPLRMHFFESCKTYGEARSKAPDSTLAEPEAHSEGVMLRTARAAGYNKVWVTLKHIEAVFKKPGDWALQIIVRLNLQLNEMQRSQIMMMSDFWSANQPNLGDVADAFSKYLDNDNAGQLLQKLDALGTPWEKTCP